MLLDAALAFRHVACEEDHDRVEVGTRQIAHPVVRMVRAGVSEYSARAAMPCRNSSGNVASDAVVHAERAQTVAGERDGDPSRIG